MRPLFLAALLVLVAFALPSHAKAQTDGQLDPTFAPVIRDRGQVERVLPAPDGRFLVVGKFTHLHGRSAASGAWLTAAGQFAGEFRAQPPAGFSDQPLGVFPDGRVLARRESTAPVALRPAPRLVRLEAGGATDASFQSPDLAGLLRALVLPSGKVLVRLRGSEFHPLEPRGILRLRNDGSVDPTFVPPTRLADSGDAIALQSDGKILTRASHSAVIDGVTVERFGLTRLQPDGALDPTFQYSGPRLPGGPGFLGDWPYVDQLVMLPDNRFFVHGDFALIGRPPDDARALLRVLAHGAHDPAFDPGVLEFLYSVVPLTDGGALATVGVSSGSGGTTQVVRFLPNGGRDATFAGGAGAIPFNGYNELCDLQPRPGGRAILFGNFYQVGFIRRSSLAGIGADGTVDPAFAAGAGAESEQPKIREAVLTTGGKLWIAGAFSSIDGLLGQRLARLRADGTLDASFVPPADLLVALELNDDGTGGLYALASFSGGDGYHFGLAHFLADGRLDPAFQPPAELAPFTPRSFYASIERVLRQPGGKLLVQGYLPDPATGLDAQPRILRLQANGALEAGFQILAPEFGQLVLGPGGRIQIGSKAFHADGSPDASFAPPPGTFPENQDPSAMAVDAEGRLLVADFLRDYGDPAQAVAHRQAGGLRRFLRDGSLDPTFRPPPRPYGAPQFGQFDVLSVQPDGRILAGGSFLSVGGRDQNSLVRLTATGAVDLAFSAGAGVFATQPVLPFFTQPISAIVNMPGGDVIVAGEFASFRGEPRAGLARLKVTPQPAVPAVGAGRLVNVSTRAYVGTGQEIMIGGFVLRGTGIRRLILRGMGPSLTAFGVTNALLNPTLRLVDAAGQTVATNDDWAAGGAPAGLAEAGLAPAEARESAIVANLSAGAYTVLVSGVNGTSGVALVEIYDVDPAGSIRLVNLATRALTDRPRGDGTFEPTIGGFAVRGGKLRVVLRGMGPSLAAAGVVAPFGDPDLTLRLANGADLVYQTGSAQQPDASYSAASLQSVGLRPARSEEAAFVLDLPEGNYTAVMDSEFSQGSPRTGVAIFEVYDVEESALAPSQP